MSKELLKTIKFNNEKTILEIHRDHDLTATIPYDGYEISVSSPGNVYNFSSIYNGQFNVELAIKEIEAYKNNLPSDKINSYLLYTNIKDICNAINLTTNE